MRRLIRRCNLNFNFLANKLDVKNNKMFIDLNKRFFKRTYGKVSTSFSIFKIGKLAES